MAKKVFVTGKAELKVTVSRLMDPVDKSKVRVRGPNQVGQLKHLSTIHLGKVDEEELNKRVAAAKDIIKTGKVPVSMKGGHPKAKDATLAKAKGDLTKAKNYIAKLEAALEKKSEEKPEDK